MISKIKKILIKCGFNNSGFLFETFRTIRKRTRKTRARERIADLFGFLGVGKVSESELKALWKLVNPNSNGHQLIRIGERHDGGYLLPHDFDGVSSCFSPGAGTVWTFEESLGADFNIPSHVCDGTITQFPAFDSLASFKPMNIGLVESNSVMSFTKWVESESKVGQDLILQMDIDGAEYMILPSLDPKFLERFRIVVLELHDLHLLAFEGVFAEQFKLLMKNLNLNFDVVHLHPNHLGGSYIAFGQTLPKVVEITLHRKDRSKNLSEAKIPHHLDAPNYSEIGEFPSFRFVDWFRTK